jgi:hypothetical protein
MVEIVPYQKTAYLTKPSRSIVTGDMATRTMVLKLVVQLWFLWKRRWCSGGGNCQDVEVF